MFDSSSEENDTGASRYADAYNRISATYDAQDMLDETDSADEDWVPEPKEHRASSKATVHNSPPVTFGHPPGVQVGDRFPSRKELRKAGVHQASRAGIHGRASEGAYSIVMSGLYEDDGDKGERILYTGTGGQKEVRTLGVADSHKRCSFRSHVCSSRCDTQPGNGGQQVSDQSFEHPMNKYLLTSIRTGNPVRVVRGSTLSSKYAPREGYRYDGLYKVEDAYYRTGRSGFQICLFELRRVPGQPPLPILGLSSDENSADRTTTAFTSASASRRPEGRQPDNTERTPRRTHHKDKNPTTVETRPSDSSHKKRRREPEHSSDSSSAGANKKPRRHHEHASTSTSKSDPAARPGVHNRTGPLPHVPSQSLPPPPSSHGSSSRSLDRADSHGLDKSANGRKESAAAETGAHTRRPGSGFKFDASRENGSATTSMGSDRVRASAARTSVTPVSPSATAARREEGEPALPPGVFALLPWRPDPVDAGHGSPQAVSSAPAPAPAPSPRAALAVMLVKKEGNEVVEQRALVSVRAEEDEGAMVVDMKAAR
ncbi:PUA-like domain-containing protein [Lenzites betulinus]|nr:PUA-like domain-containing protein [Lenzites betulinus]